MLSTPTRNVVPRLLGATIALVLGLGPRHQTVAAGTRRYITDGPCQLQCTNGGYCAVYDWTSEELISRSEQGQLVEVCVCQPGYTGVACENKIEECDMEELTCPNGEMCYRSASHRWSCDCSVADSMSLFAGQMCRDPITQYCGSHYLPDTEKQNYCTNGGRCKADFLRAQAEAAQKDVTYVDEGAGCVCPPEFDGPHCEWLIENQIGSWEKDKGEESESEESLPTRGDEKKEPAPAATHHSEMNKLRSQRLYLIAMLVLTSVLLLTLLAHLHQRRMAKKHEQARNSMLVDYDDLMQPGYLENISPFFNVKL